MLPGGQPAKKAPKARLQKLKGGTVVKGVVVQIHPLHLFVQLPEGESLWPSCPESLQQVHCELRS